MNEYRTDAGNVARLYGPQDRIAQEAAPMPTPGTLYRR